MLDRLHDGVQRGRGGVKLYPVLALFDPTDERYDPFYRAAAGLIVLWHMGPTPNPAGKLSVSNPLVADVSAAWARPLDGYLVLVRAGASSRSCCSGRTSRSGRPPQPPRSCAPWPPAPDGLPPIDPATVDRLLEGDPRKALGG